MASNRNSYGFSSPDVINERAEAASARAYGGEAIVKSSDYVGIPGLADDRMKGITGATPLITNGETTAVKQSNNSDPQLNVKLNSQANAARRSGTTYMPTKDGGR